MNVMRTRRTYSSSNPVAPWVHRSVLLHEAIEALVLRPGDTVVDATLGGAGHAREIVRCLGREGVFIGFDLDSDAIGRAEETLAGAACRVELIGANFRRMAPELALRGIERIDKALFDLGWSAEQLGARRGFSFLKDEPLLMTYAPSSGPHALTAATVVNEWSEASLADVIFGWGGERYARRIARAIAEHRQRKPIKTTGELVAIILEASPLGYRKGRLHPATRTFQALRIVVNDELGALGEGLEAAWQLLAPGGRVAVISFHSLEDRMVKRLFAGWEKEGAGKRLTKKPVVSSAEELTKNPRARSAKLRAIEKIL